MKNDTYILQGQVLVHILVSMLHFGVLNMPMQGLKEQNKIVGVFSSKWQIAKYQTGLYFVLYLECQPFGQGCALIIFITSEGLSGKAGILFLKITCFTGF